MTLSSTPRAGLALAILLAGSACSVAETRESGERPLDSSQFKERWFAGQAELTRYALEQARYGEIHRGDAVLIFVTEDFLPDKQVKADSGDRARTAAVPVMKLNFTREFNTGIYPYSIMTSVFTPLDIDRLPRTLKTSTSVQEWCGHTYLQLNLRDGRYRVQGNSYFESEGDRVFAVEAAWLEDELWSRIRLAPWSLPVGAVEMIPGGQFSRLRHREVAVERAQASLADSADGTLTYTIDYPEVGRSLSIRFERRFPHGIVGWEETQPSGFGPRARPLTTRATRTHSLLLDYWSRNSNADLPLRDRLGLE